MVRRAAAASSSLAVGPYYKCDLTSPPEKPYKQVSFGSTRVQGPLRSRSATHQRVAMW